MPVHTQLRPTDGTPERQQEHWPGSPDRSVCPSSASDSLCALCHVMVPLWILQDCSVWARNVLAPASSGPSVRLEMQHLLTEPGKLWRLLGRGEQRGLHPQRRPFGEEEQVGPLKEMTASVPDGWDSSRMGTTTKKPRRENFVGCGYQEDCLEAAVEPTSDTGLMLGEAESWPWLPWSRTSGATVVRGSPVGPSISRPSAAASE